MPMQTSKFKLDDPSRVDSDKWIHYPINDNLQIRILKAAIEKQTETQDRGGLDLVSIGGGYGSFMYATGLSTFTPSVGILGRGYVYEMDPFEIIDVGNNPHKIKLKEEEAIQIAKAIFQHFEIEKMARKAEDYFGGLVKELEHHVVTERGWDLVKDLLPPVDLDTLQRGEPVQIRGSDGHLWLVNAKGQVYRDAKRFDLFENDESDLHKLMRKIQGDQRKGTNDSERPLQGAISGNYYTQAGWVFPDKLAALIKLIQHDAQRLVRKWGCGNLYLEGGDLV